MKPQIYSVRIRSGMERTFSIRKSAIIACRDEIKDGWPSWVRDMRTGTIIYPPRDRVRGGSNE